MRTLPLNRRCSRSRFSHGGRRAVRCENIALRRSMVIKSKPSESLNLGESIAQYGKWKHLNTLLARRKLSRDMTSHSQSLNYFMSNSYRHDAFKRRRFESRGFFCAARNTILEDKRVSAFRNFLMSASAESFSFFVFDTVQSEGTNKLKSRM
jgi:hypothetical protein